MPGLVGTFSLLESNSEAHGEFSFIMASFVVLLTVLLLWSGRTLWIFLRKLQAKNQEPAIAKNLFLSCSFRTKDSNSGEIGYIRELSCRSMKLVTDRSLPKGVSLTLVLSSLPNYPNKRDLIGKVAYSRSFNGCEKTFITKLVISSRNSEALQELEAYIRTIN